MILIDTANNVYMDDEESLVSFQKVGVKRIISLYPLKTEGFLRSFPNDLGMEHYPMPCSNFFPPDDSAIQKILTLVPDGKMTVIIGPPSQLGFVVAAYRMQLLNWTPDYAFTEWNKVRSWWTFWWDNYLKDWER